MIDTFGKIAIIVIIGLVIFFSVFLTFGMMDAKYQKEQLDNMDCNELKEYIIEKALSFGGFPDIAKDLHKYKCELATFEEKCSC